MGSGPTGIAAKQLGRNFIGIEISRDYCEIARQRISAAGSGGFVLDPSAGSGTAIRVIQDCCLIAKQRMKAA